jgi:hypothetical protein
VHRDTAIVLDRPRGRNDSRRRTIHAQVATWAEPVNG